MSFEAFTTADGLIALVTLTVLEVVLGIDNVIFISILAGKLPRENQEKARRVGLLAAMGMRILLLMSIAWIVRLTAPLFSVGSRPFSGRDLILIIGGIFLLFKATREIHDKLEGEEGHVSARVAPSLAAVIGQIMLLDIVFSLDSVITAVGMADDLAVMVTAVVIAVGIMMFAARPVSEFVDAHPTVKVLALSFLLLIGCSLVADGFGAHIPKGYIYFAMGFSVFVEVINLRMSKKGKAVKLHDGYHPPAANTK
jgi:predicted tellurium resistance membrane protein TerC